MQRVYFYRFSDVVGKFEFKCRTPDVRFTREMLDELNAQLDDLCELTYEPREIEYLKSIWYHKDAVGFLEFLRCFRLNREFIKATLSLTGELMIEAAGPLWAVSPFEIYVLALVNEIYFKHRYAETNIHETFKRRLDAKMTEWKNHEPFALTEFGTRRRLSVVAQKEVLMRLRDEIGSNLVGTSNVALAMRYKLKPMGTFAHEYVCMPQGLNDCSLRNSQRYAWDQWCREYRGALGICLTDTLGQDKFEKDFDRYWANMFTGLRHDSGDPIQWGEKAIEMYKRLDVDPRTKTLMFSDGLDFPTCWKLDEHFRGRVKTAFGVGTWLTNDTDVEPLNIVMKLVEVNGRPVAKLSNVEGKAMGDEGHVARLRAEIAS